MGFVCIKLSNVFHTSLHILHYELFSIIQVTLPNWLLSTSAASSQAALLEVGPLYMVFLLIWRLAAPLTILLFTQEQRPEMLRNMLEWLKCQSHCPDKDGFGPKYQVTGLPLWLGWQRIRLQCGRPGFDPWIGKIPWRREWLPTPVFWSGEFRELYNPWGRKESNATERLALHQVTRLRNSGREDWFL